MKSTRNSDIAVSSPRVSRAWTGRKPRTHRPRCGVSPPPALHSALNSVSSSPTTVSTPSPASAPRLPTAQRRTAPPTRPHGDCFAVPDDLVEVPADPRPRRGDDQDDQNPVRDASPMSTKPKNPPRALTVPQAAQLMALLTYDDRAGPRCGQQCAERRVSKTGKPGRARTRCRISFHRTRSWWRRSLTPSRPGSSSWSRSSRIRRTSAASAGWASSRSVNSVRASSA